MTDSIPSFLKADAIAASNELEFHHPLNPNSEVYLRSLSRATGLNRIAVSLCRIPPGKESFIYHAHSNEEEWIYILSGRGIAEIGDKPAIMLLSLNPERRAKPPQPYLRSPSQSEDAGGKVLEAKSSNLGNSGGWATPTLQESTPA